MKKKTPKLLSILLCFVMLVGLMPTSVFAAGTKLETPQNLKLQGTVLSWDAVDNADFYGITLYHPNYVYSIGSWQTDGTSINLYKYLKDGETYGATVIACSNGSYQISTPAEIPLTACTNAGVPIYRDVNVVNGTSSASTAYPGMSVRLEAKPAPDGMVFDRWELSGGYINIGYSDTNTVIYVQAICDNDISARATYKYQENVTSAFTVQPQGGAALVGEYFDVTYAMNFAPQGTVKVQVEGNTPGDFTDLKQGEIDSASIKEDSVVTKTFRIMASDGTRNIYSDEFVVSWEDGPRFISQPMGGTVDHNVDFVATYALNFTPFSCRVERYSDYLYQWVDLSNASATEATINSYDFNTSSNYRIKAIIEGGGEVYSDEFTVTWSDAVSKFIQQPVGGTVGFDEDFTFTFAINFTPASNIAIQKYNSGFDSWDTVGYCASLTSGTISGFASETTNKYRLEAYENGTPIYSNEFTVTWEGTDYTVSFAANGGSGTMADVNNVSGEYTLPACGFTAPNGQRFKAWLVGGNEKAVGDKITVSANTVVTAVWENIPEYIVSYNANGGSGTMVGDMVTENGTFTLETCTYIAPEGYKFKAWAIGSVNGVQKQPGEQITITGETYIYAIWEELPTAMVSYNENGGSGTMVGDVVTIGGKFTLENCTYIAPEGYKFKAWAIGSVNGEQKQPGEQITITAETYIYAIWEAVEYNVTVTGGTASVGAGTPITKATMGTTVTLIAGQAPAGQEFDKWVVNGVVVADANSTTTTFVMPAGEVTATATYKDIPVVTYTVTFDANGGTGSMAAASGVSGDYVLPVCGFTAPNGKQFKAWSVGGVEKAEGATITVNANTTVTAVWENIPVTYYTVTFDSNGGSAVTAQTIEAGQKATKPADPTKAGYDFKGWTLNGSAYDFNSTVNGNITLVATWEQQQVVPTMYTVTFDSAGGSAVTAQNIEAGQKATKPADPTKTGYDFKGWTLNGSAYDFNSAVNGNITLVATWEQQQVQPTMYTVTFDSDGGSAVTAQTIEEGQKATKPADPTRDGYDFKGWTLNGSAYDFNSAVNGNITLVATWEQQQVVPTTYTVTFDSNGGSAVTAQTIEAGQKATKPADPTKDGYDFKGWTLNGSAYDFNSAVNGNITLVATWEQQQVAPTTYTVTFDSNGGSVTPASAVTDADGKLDSLPTPTRSGSYSFNGWYTAASGGTKVTTSTVFAENTTIYAQWSYTGGGGGGGYVTVTYAITVADTKNGDVTVNTKSAVKGETITLTVDPDKGYTLETLTVTDKNGKEIELTNKGDGKYTFKMPASKVTVKATFMDDNTMLNFFVDVPADAYYYDAVLWAVKEGITNGTSATTFSPDNPCTRAQMATFLWRAAGSPEPVSKTCIFTDVPADAYYAKTVQWAYEQKITVGTSATTFSPDETCTRAQMATFLCRVADGKPVSDTVIFADVKADKYYAKAVQWAYEQKITVGTSATTFSPDDPCTRAQMVTFLYRYFVK